MTEKGAQQPARTSGSATACRRCEAPLAPDQRYCLECGTRVGPLAVPGSPPPPKPAAPTKALPIRVPAPRSAGALAAMTLAFGVFVGFAVGPSLSGVGFAGGQLVVNVPGQADSSTNGSGESASASAGGGSVTLGNPVGNAGGGRSTPPPAALTPVAAVAPPPASPAPPPSTPEKQPPPHQPAAPHGGGSPPPPEEVPPTEGTVVHLNPVAGSYTLATSGGGLMPVHADELPKAGSRVSVVVRQLFNGTFAEKGKRSVKGDETQAKLTGYVSYRDPTANVYALSVRGASMLIHVPDDETDGSPAMPPLGAYAQTMVKIEQPKPEGKRSRDQRRRAATTADPECTAGTGPDAGSGAVLDQTHAKFTLPPVHYVDMEGIVGDTCTDPGQMTLSADDVRESTQNLLLAAPSPIDVTKLESGDAIDVTAELGDDGSYTVTGLSSDQGVEGASDRSAAQGDQAP